jgi:hypothetical protein
MRRNLIRSKLLNSDRRIHSVSILHIPRNLYQQTLYMELIIQKFIFLSTELVLRIHALIEIQVFAVDIISFVDLKLIYVILPCHLAERTSMI